MEWVHDSPRNGWRLMGTPYYVRSTLNSGFFICRRDGKPINEKQYDTLTVARKVCEEIALRNENSY